jgi:hypothetical protein
MCCYARQAPAIQVATRQPAENGPMRDLGRLGGGLIGVLVPPGRPPSGQNAIAVANMYRFKKCYILARTSLLLLPFRYAAAVLYNSDNRRERGGDFYSAGFYFGAWDAWF